MILELKGHQIEFRSYHGAQSCSFGCIFIYVFYISSLQLLVKDEDNFLLYGFHLIETLDNYILFEECQKDCLSARTSKLLIFLTATIMYNSLQPYLSA